MASASALRPTTSSSKRSRSSDSQRSTSTTPIPVGSKSLDSTTDPTLPAFLRQSKSEIFLKFEEMYRRHADRWNQGRRNQDPSSPWALEFTEDTKERNRYSNILAWKNSRVHLKVPEGICDYINASPISLRCSTSGTEYRYIATQGPKHTGVNEFWHMTWHETSKVAVIVMLTELADRGVEKCFQYYPSHPDDDTIDLVFPNETPEGVHGHVKLIESMCDQAARTTIRKLLLTHGEESKTVWHLLYEDWPDHGIPENVNCASMLELIKLSQIKNEGPENLRIIHCSAGVGRSGTFIALEHLLNELETGAVAEAKESEDMIFETVDRLRAQRMMMVQSWQQFQFLYDLLRHEYQKKRQEQLASKASSEANAVTPESSFTTMHGEPSPKARKLSRGLKTCFLRDKTSSVLKEGGDGREGEGKAPETN